MIALNPRKIEIDGKRKAADRRNLRDVRRYGLNKELIEASLLPEILNILNHMVLHFGKDVAFRYAQNQRPDLFGEISEDSCGRLA